MVKKGNNYLKIPVDLLQEIFWSNLFAETTHTKILNDLTKIKKISMTFFVTNILSTRALVNEN